LSLKIELLHPTTMFWINLNSCGKESLKDQLNFFSNAEEECHHEYSG